MGGIALPEISMPSGSAGTEIIAGDSTTHTPSWNNNNNGISSPYWRMAMYERHARNGQRERCDGPEHDGLHGPGRHVNALANAAGQSGRSLFDASASTSQMTLKIKLCTVSGCGSGTVISPISIQSTALARVQITNDISAPAANLRHRRQGHLRPMKPTANI